MATYFTLTERRNICPACHAVNVLIGNALVDGMDICCSRCGSFIGRWSETRDMSFDKKSQTRTAQDEDVHDKYDPRHPSR